MSRPISTSGSLSPGLRKALQTLSAHQGEGVRTGRSTGPYQVATSAAEALERRGLAVINHREVIRIEYEAEITDEGLEALALWTR